MAISTDFNYDNLLSLNKAKLIKRFRLNYLGSQELILDYQGVTGASREDCIEWLEANRLTLGSPKFGFKTYEGTWYCVDINYNEDKKTIRQRFKIDSSLKGDVSKRGAVGSSYKDYYWRVVDPARYTIPSHKSESDDVSAMDDAYWYDSGTTNSGFPVSITEDEAYAHWYNGSDYYITANENIGTVPANYLKLDEEEGDYIGFAGSTYDGDTVTFKKVGTWGEEWTKTCNDNGDGTYDVIITNTTATSELSGAGSIRTGSPSGEQDGTDSIFVTNSGDTDYDGEYEYRYIDANGNPYWSKPGYESSGASLTPDLNGLKWYLDENRSISGYPACLTADGLYVCWQYSGWHYIALVSDFGSGTSAPTNRFELGSTNPIGTYTARGSYSGTLVMSGINGDAARGIVYDSGVSARWKIISRGYYITEYTNYSHYLAQNTPLAPSPWYTPGPVLVPAMVAEIGRTGAAYKEDSSIAINSAPAAFTSQGGSITMPVAGEVITISNKPMNNGTFRTTVVTRTGLPQRLPALYGFYFYDSNGNDFGNGILHGKNRTQQQFEADLALLSGTADSLSKEMTDNANSVSVNINASGLLDYTILSNKPKAP